MTPVANWPTLLEIFPQDSDALWHPTLKTGHCVQHALELGCRKPVPVFGTYANRRPGPVPLGQADPSWYPMGMHHGLYTMDDIGTRWQTWRWPA